MIALLITVVLAMILFAHDMVISIFNAIRYKMLESGAQSAEVIIYKNVLDLDINGYGYSVSFIAYLFMSAYHIKFLIIYINRLLTIGFLIVVAPIISVTYALDKIGDRKKPSSFKFLQRVCRCSNSWFNLSNTIFSIYICTCSNHSIKSSFITFCYNTIFKSRKNNKRDVKFKKINNN